METMRESWTDTRLDDFAAHTDKRFDSIESRMKDGFDRVDAELKALNARFDALNRTLLQIGGGVIVALLGILATQL